MLLMKLLKIFFLIATRLNVFCTGDVEMEASNKLFICLSGLQKNIWELQVVEKDLKLEHKRIKKNLKKIV